MTKSKSKSLEPASQTVKETSQKTTNDNLVRQTSQHWPYDDGTFAPFHSLRREVDGLFNQFTNRFGNLSRQTSEALQIPPMDVDETENSFEVSAELPGVAEKDIEVSVTDSVLTIHGEKQHRTEAQDMDQRIAECSYGVFERSLSLPFSCDAKTIDAKYNNGVLHLSIPKPKQPPNKTQKVAIKSAA